MTDDLPAIDTRLHAGPFDAFSTAKPDEPVFTLQGGDPYAPDLVLAWAQRARADAMEIGNEEGRELESHNLLLRASSAEQVAWSMQAYQRGWPSDSEAITASSKTSGEYILDVYDTRKKLARLLSGIDADLLSAVENLQTFEHSEAESLYYAGALYAIEQIRMLAQQAAERFNPSIRSPKSD